MSEPVSGAGSRWPCGAQARRSPVLLPLLMEPLPSACFCGGCASAEASRTVRAAIDQVTRRRLGECGLHRWECSQPNAARSDCAHLPTLVGARLLETRWRNILQPNNTDDDNKKDTSKSEQLCVVQTSPPSETTSTVSYPSQTPSTIDALWCNPDVLQKGWIMTLGGVAIN